MTFFVQNWVGKDAFCYLRNEQLNPLMFCDLFQRWGAVVFVSMTCIYIGTFHVSVRAQNATMVIYGTLFGGMHPLSLFFKSISECTLTSESDLSTYCEYLVKTNIWVTQVTQYVKWDMATTRIYDLLINIWLWYYNRGARCSSMVRVFAHGAMDCRINPSWWTHW